MQTAMPLSQTRTASAPQSSPLLRFERRAVVIDGPHRAACNLPEPLRPGVLVLNAPRPLVGHRTWTGDFVQGRFYALVLPEGTDRAGDHTSRTWMLRRNHGLRAAVLRFVTEEQAQAEVRAYYANHPVLSVYLRAYAERGLWERHWFGAWFDYCAWDSVEVAL